MNQVMFNTRTKVRSLPSLNSKVYEIADAGSVAAIPDKPVIKAEGYEWWYLQHITGTLGYSARKSGTEILFTVEYELFREQIEFTLFWEGGYVNDPNDPGMETNYGISKRSYPDLDILNLTKEQAIAIYYEDYWLRSKAYLYPYPKCLFLLDIAVLSGVGRIPALRELSDTGILSAQLDFFVNLSGFYRYGKGWVRRTSSLLNLL